MSTQASILGAARWLLLLLTAFGLTTMHTVGHAGMQMSDPVAAGMSAAVAAAAHAPASAAVSAAPQPCAGDHCPHHTGMDGWSICLAILGGLAVIVLLAIRLATRRHAPPTTAAATGRGGRGSRGPPRPPTGLLIASTAVLRI
ncbi:hypothetical protein [Paractinoplanes durhamensis]|uniref:hypothetical protein n=1 Tax=Paractinoplanes durhamensis TaxID=113563 RepID=UPI0019405114|nr:hypothetical protein [Actinoplanes durhamensis]